ncbi:MAG TPA: hypothetical protein VFA17_08805 [Thermoplasmata archaeon]|jgi:hypothetical protein|nr:hypothetical protein [Thermoplasmata archaeon]
MAEDPLAGLVVKKEDLDRKLLGEVLAPYVRLDQDSGAVIATPAFAALTNAAKILVLLLGRKAARALSLQTDPEEISPKAISTLTGINYDSVKPTLSMLHKKRIVQKVGDGYVVPDRAMLLVRSELERAVKEGGHNVNSVR